MKPPTLTLDDERTYPETADQATFQHHVARYGLRWSRSGRAGACWMRGAERGTARTC